MTLAIQPAHQHKTCPIPDTGSWRMAVMENDLRHLGRSCVSLSCVTAAELLNISEQFSHLKKKKKYTPSGQSGRGKVIMSQLTATQ